MGKQMRQNQEDRQIKLHTTLTLALSRFGMVGSEQPGERRTERDLPVLPAPAARPRPAVTASWHRTDDDRLEVRWHPTAPEAV
jgi:hypothetical protein